MGLKLIFLIATRAVTLLGLPRRERWRKDAEILMLRHQLAVAQRERPRAHARLTWPDRAWLALLAGTVPAERLAAMRLIVTPGTIVRWHRDIVRRRRARVAPWPLRPPAGAPQRTVCGAAAGPRERVLDFFTAGLLNGTKVYVLAAIEHGTRRIWILGATQHPVQAWVVQQARNLLMDLEDAGRRVKFVLHDWDASFTAAFGAVFRAGGARVVCCAVQAPRMNPVTERWVGSCRRELLDRTLIWNRRHLMTVLREYEGFYNTHRPHRALKQAAPLRPVPDGVTDLDHFRVRRRDRAGGVIHEYRLVA